jgi:hypothetical protein
VGVNSKRDATYICVLGALAAYFMVWPIWRAQFPIEIWFTEGWNAYHQDAAAAGLPLYPTADQLIVNNYPPLSFFAIGALGKIFGDNLFVGRAVSLIGVVAIAVEVTLVVQLLTARWVAGALGALWFVAFMAHNASLYVGANDPQISGLAIMGAALVWLIARDRAREALEPPLLLMMVAGFWKHNAIGVPLAAVTWMVVRDWRSAVRPALVATSAGALGLLACRITFGAAFFENLLTPRAYSVGHLLSQTGHLQWVALGTLIWAAWAVSARQSYAAKFTATLIAWGLFSCLLQWLGDGVFGNAEFDLILATAIGLGVAMARTETSWLARRIGAGPTRDVIIALLVLRLVASGRQESAAVLFDPTFRLSYAEEAQRQTAMISEVAATPGLVMCWNNNVLCRRAGKAFAVDDFKTDQFIATHRFTAAEVDQMLRDRGITVFTGATKLPIGLAFIGDKRS